MIDSVSAKVVPSPGLSAREESKDNNVDFFDLLFNGKSSDSHAISAPAGEKLSADQILNPGEDKDSVALLRGELVTADILSAKATVANDHKATVDELYEQKWYATGHLSYEGQLYHTRTNEQFSKVIPSSNTDPTKVIAPENSNPQNILQNSGTLNSSVGINTASQATPTRKALSTDLHLGHTTLAAVPEYLRKKITYARSGDQLTVFIRDYSLSEPEKASLVRSIAESIKKSGNTINSLVLNGREYLVNNIGEQ